MCQGLLSYYISLNSEPVEIHTYFQQSLSTRTSDILVMGRRPDGDSIRRIAEVRVARVLTYGSNKRRHEGR